MKTYKHLWETCLSRENRKKAVRKALRGKRARQLMRNEGLTFEMVVDKSEEWIINFSPAEHIPKNVIDSSSGKVRTIVVPTLEELVVQYCVVEAMLPMLTKGMYTHTYASIPKRGAHAAAKKIKKWMKDDPKNTKYCLKMDIRHFFDSIDQRTLENLLFKHIKDENFCRLLARIIETTETGLPIGFYTSQWFANYYLQRVDHFIKDLIGIKYYVRYMDDMVMFGSNKKRLKHLRRALASYLKYQRDLTIKKDWQIFPTKLRDVDFMGFRFSSGYTRIRRRIFYRLCRKISKVSKKVKINSYDARSILSYNSWIKHTNSYTFNKTTYGPFLANHALRSVVSIADKKYYRRALDAI